METVTFDSFTKKIYIKAPIEKLYWSKATTEDIESWFLRKAQFFKEKGELRNSVVQIKAGDSYVWEWQAFNL